jgi:hypothetical protein
MYCSKTIIFLFIFCFSISCDSSETSPISSNKSKNHVSNENLNNEQNTNNSNPKEIDSPDEKELSNAKIQSPYQTKPRRTKINFAEDCEYKIGDKFKLETACASAINSVIPDLPSNPCVYDQYLRNTKVSDGSAFLSLQNFSVKEAFPIKFYALSQNKYLVQIYCNSGAYNIENVYLLYDESKLPAKARVLEFPWIEPDSHILNDFSYLKPPSDDYIAKYINIVKEKTVGGIQFNPKTKTLIAYSKGNGMGKFGQYARYSFKKNGEPILEEFRARFYDDVYNQDYPNYDNDDVIKHPPKTWKRYYP